MLRQFSASGWMLKLHMDLVNIPGLYQNGKYLKTLSIPVAARVVTTLTWIFYVNMFRQVKFEVN